MSTESGEVPGWQGAIRSEYREYSGRSATKSDARRRVQPEPPPGELGIAARAPTGRTGPRDFVRGLLSPGFPSYRHRPGRTPHPERDPAGHRFLDRLPSGWLPAPRVPLEGLGENPLFLYGLRLLEARYFWEAHAVWEELWRSAQSGSAEAHLLRGLIQRAAAALKRDLGNPAGADKLTRASEAAIAAARLAVAAGDPERRPAALEALDALVESAERAPPLRS